jgi:predicted permease
MPTLLRNLHFAIRQLRRSPSFAITAVLTLALGVGANVVVFSVLNALILKPLTVPQPHSLYNVVHRSSGYDSQSYPDYLDLRSRNTTFSDMTAYRMNDAALSTGNAAEKCWDFEVSGNYFDMLGVRPALGRLFHASDEHGPNSAPYIVLSHDFWQRHFNSDPHVVGMTVDLNKNPFTVIGVAPGDFHGTELFMWPDFWVPIVNEQQIEGFNYLNQRSDHGIWVLGRLKPGVAAQQATNNLNAVASRLAKQYPVADDGLNARLVKPGLLGDQLGAPVRGFLTGIFALALLVLLAACANLGSIFAARAADRSRELAIRLAVGSTRGRILGQLLTESVAVSIVGGVAGTFFATGLLRVLSRWQPFAEFPIHVTVLPDWKVYAVALLLCLGSGILFGLLPARQIWRTDAGQVMKSGASAVVTFRRLTLRDALLAFQIALCTLLVTASLVAFRGMQRSLHAPLGVEPQGVTLATTDLGMAGYSFDQSLPIQKRMIEEASHSRRDLGRNHR